MRRNPCVGQTSDALLYAGHCTIAVQLAAAETAQLRPLVDAALAEVAALSAQASAISQWSVAALDQSSRAAPVSQLGAQRSTAAGRAPPTAQ